MAARLADTLLTLSRAYEEQATFVRKKELLIGALLRRSLDRDVPSLLSEYERTLDALGVPADSLERP